MLLPKKFFIFLTILAQIGQHSKTQLLNFNGILPLIPLQEIEQIIDDPLLGNFQLILLLKQRRIGEGLEASFSPLYIIHIGQKFGQTKNSLLFFEIVFHVQNQIGQNGQCMLLELP